MQDVHQFTDVGAWEGGTKLSLVSAEKRKAGRKPGSEVIQEAQRLRSGGFEGGPTRKEAVKKPTHVGPGGVEIMKHRSRPSDPSRRRRNRRVEKIDL